ncbi:hypothetical protein ACP3W1_26530, partial [Salmonella enterica]|uniref:hypothetical protein n=1 Tax=Salmonella enterica TaxID=28901 RepID=UPI003CEB9A47
AGQVIIPSRIGDFAQGRQHGRGALWHRARLWTDPMKAALAEPIGESIDQSREVWTLTPEALEPFALC